MSKITKKINHKIKSLFASSTVKIKAGPLQGYRISLLSGSGFISGNYEPEKTDVILNNVKTSDIVLDVGAHIGYFTMLMAKLVGGSGHIYSFEPRPLNYKMLENNIKTNKLTNVTIKTLAIGNKTGKVNFDATTGTGTGHISKDGNITVEITTVDKFCKDENITPSFIKIDIEGGEVEALKGAEQTIENYKPKILLATHGDKLDRECEVWMQAKGYTGKDINQLKGDKETIWIHN